MGKFALHSIDLSGSFSFKYPVPCKFSMALLQDVFCSIFSDHQSIVPYRIEEKFYFIQSNRGSNFHNFNMTRNILVAVDDSDVRYYCGSGVSCSCGVGSACNVSYAVGQPAWRGIR